MLKQTEVQAAVEAGRKQAGCCTRFCMVGAETEGETYRCWHSGVGSSTTDVQTVYAPKALALDVHKFGDRVSTWIAGLHKGQPVNLNGE